MTDSSEPRRPELSGLVRQALELEPAERAAFLVERCGEDAELLAAAQARLAAEGPVEADGRSPRSPRGEPTTRPGRPHGIPLGLGSKVGNYVLKRYIKSGGFGMVWEAERLGPVKQRVAVKIMRTERDTDDGLERFDLERRALAAMTHSGIAKFYDAGRAGDGQPYFAMEYVHGDQVVTYCDKHALGVAERIEIFLGICDAVQHAHRRGIIHRDLKPDNILIAIENDKPVPKVIDFGIARYLSEVSGITERDQVVGTLSYMSPEQAESLADIDVRADVYALGVLLYELLTGFLPLDCEVAARLEAYRLIREEEPVKPSSRLTTGGGAGDAAQATAKANERHTDVRTLTRRLYGDLDNITMMCLRKEPAHRYSGVDRLANDLRRYQNNDTVEATTPSLGYRARKFYRRNRAKVISGAIIGALLTFGAVTFTVADTERRIAVRALDKQTAKKLVAEARTLVLAYRFPSLAPAAFRPRSPVDRTFHGALYEKANNLLATALKKDPDLLEAKIQQVHLLAKSGERELAAARAHDVVRQHPKSESAVAVLAGLLRDEAKTRALIDKLGVDPRVDHWLYYTALVTEAPGDAIDLLRRSLENNDWFVDAQLLLTIRLFDAGQYDEMLGEAKLLSRVARESAFTWNLLGTALSFTGRHQEAIDAFSKLVEHEPDGWRGYMGRAWNLGRLRKYAEALADYSRAVANDPENCMVRVLIAEVRARTPDKRAALADYDRAIELGCRDGGVYGGRGEMHYLLEQREESLADLTTALELLGESRLSLRNELRVRRGVVLQDLERPEEARVDLEAGVAGNPLDPWRRGALGRFYRDAGLYSEAIVEFEQATRLDPSGWHGLLAGTCHWFAGELPAARKAFDAFKDRPDGHWIHLWIWDLERSRKRPTEASAALDLASKASDDAVFAAVIAVLRDEAEPAAVLDMELRPNEHLYALYLLGAQARHEGHFAAAQGYYHDALALGLKGEVEHAIVRHQLRGL